MKAYHAFPIGDYRLLRFKVCLGEKARVVAGRRILQVDLNVLSLHNSHGADYFFSTTRIFLVPDLASSGRGDLQIPNNPGIIAIIGKLLRLIGIIGHSFGLLGNCWHLFRIIRIIRIIAIIANNQDIQQGNHLYFSLHIRHATFHRQFPKRKNNLICVGDQGSIPSRIYWAFLQLRKNGLSRAPRVEPRVVGCQSVVLTAELRPQTP